MSAWLGWSAFVCSTVKWNLLVWARNFCTARKINLLCKNLSYKWGFSPNKIISTRLEVEYLLNFNSSRPSNFANSWILGCSYSLQWIKKCLTDSSGAWPHLQAGFGAKPIWCKWVFKFDLFNLKWACHCEYSLWPTL